MPEGARILMGDARHGKSPTILCGCLKFLISKIVFFTASRHHLPRIPSPITTTMPDVCDVSTSISFLSAPGEKGPF
jgi:hypothetical protein